VADDDAVRAQHQGGHGAGRHILAKGFAVSATEYKEIASRLETVGVLDSAEAATLIRLAGYRNRLVHFYDEVSTRELHDICLSQLGDVERVTGAVTAWLRQHHERLDRPEQAL
jgi:uncharacterized protein YutE (UPF0331/DUF86 family)